MRSDDAVVTPRPQVPLAPLTTLGVGGRAEWYVEARTPGDVAAAHRWARERGAPLFVLGGGSNLVVADRGVPGLVLHVVIEGARVEECGSEAVVHAGAGEVWDRLVANVVDRGYSGMECLSGIPGLVGGTPIQNVGAYGQEIGPIVERVTVFDTRSGELAELRGAECGFGYRQSRFKQADAGRFIVCGVLFRVARGAPVVTYPDVMAWVEQSGVSHPGVADIRRAVIAIRRRKGMVLDSEDPDTRSVGSFFMNPVVPASTQDALGAPAFPMPGGREVKIPAAWLIERAGFHKGFAAGAAAVSSKHPLALVNRGGATSGDILDLACRIKRGVFDRFGVALRPEPIFAGFGDDARVAFLQKADP